jgi:hypothetical protein
MFWLLYTNQPEKKREAKKWNPCQTKELDLLVRDRGMNTRDQWWWSFRTKKQAEQGKKLIRSLNTGNTMRLYLKHVSNMPCGWE